MKWYAPCRLGFDLAWSGIHIDHMYCGTSTPVGSLYTQSNEYNIGYLIYTTVGHYQGAKDLGEANT